MTTKSTQFQKLISSPPIRPNLFEVEITPPSGAGSIDLGSFDQALGNSHIVSVTEPTKVLLASPEYRSSGRIPAKVPYDMSKIAVTLTFYADEERKLINYFQKWANEIVSEDDNRIRYYKEYIGEVKIYQLDRKTLKRKFVTTLTAAYPLQVNGIAFDNNATNSFATFNVDFNYETNTTKPV